MPKRELRLSDTFFQNITLIKSNLIACTVVLKTASSSEIEEAFRNIPEALQNSKLTGIKLTSGTKCWTIHSLDSKVAVEGTLTTNLLGKFGLALDNFKKEFDKLQKEQPNINLKKAIENIIETFGNELFKHYITSPLEMYIELYHELKKLNPSISKKTIIRNLLPIEFKKNEHGELDTSKHYPESLNEYLEATYVIEKFALKTKGKADAQSLASQLKKSVKDYFFTKLALEINDNKNNLPKNLKSLEETNKEIKEKIEAYKNTPNSEQLSLLYSLLQILAKLLPSVILSRENRKHFFFKYTGKNRATELETQLTGLCLPTTDANAGLSNVARSSR